MQTDLLDLYRQASDWTAEKVTATTDLDAPTPCDDWSVRDLLNHMLDTVAIGGQRVELSTESHAAVLADGQPGSRLR